MTLTMTLTSPLTSRLLLYAHTRALSPPIGERECARARVSGRVSVIVDGTFKDRKEETNP